MTIKQQSGVVLIISLIMLLLLTIISVTAMRVTGLEEKMAGNSKDLNVAFQAAEAALRDAENDFNSGRISGLIGMNNTCTNGLCYDGPSGIANIETDAAKIANAVPYGTYTAAPAIVGVNTPPRYLIIGFKVNGPGTVGWKYMYQMTALAEGGQNTTKSILQEVYSP